MRWSETTKIQCPVCSSVVPTLNIHIAVKAKLETKCNYIYGRKHYDWKETYGTNKTLKRYNAKRVLYKKLNVTPLRTSKKDNQ
jgi:hypothetical protein